MIKKRLIGLDQIRGVGVLLMIIFHFSYDLRVYSLPSVPSDSKLFWFWLPRLIVFIFLFCVGCSIKIAHPNEVKWPIFWRRFAKIAGAASVISLATYILFPDRWVYFGTLHCIALCSLCSIPFRHRPIISLIVGILIIAPVIITDFTYPWLNFGHQSMDYEPFLPWFYVCLLGIFVESTGILNYFSIPGFLGGKVLKYLGKKALIIYLIHQPILYGLSFLLAKIIK